MVLIAQFSFVGERIFEVVVSFEVDVSFPWRQSVNTEVTTDNGGHQAVRRPPTSTVCRLASKWLDGRLQVVNVSRAGVQGSVNWRYWTMSLLALRMAGSYPNNPTLISRP